MPVKSKAQEKYLAINHPEVLHKWKKEGVKTSTKGLPEHVKKDPDKTAKAMEKHMYGKKGVKRSK